MKLKDFVQAMEVIAPPQLAMENDNIGLLVGDINSELRRVLVALDCTLPVVAEAKRLNADLVLTHHPLMFRAVNRVRADEPATAVVHELVRCGIAMYAAHTNLDAAFGGVNDALAGIFELAQVELLAPENLGRIGTLPSEMTLAELARLAASRLNAVPRVVTAGFDRTASEIIVRRVALIGGSGGSDVLEAKLAGADVLITGEIKHSDAIDAKTVGISVIQAGHYETEAVVLRPLIEHLQKLDFGVEYYLAEFDSAPIGAI